MRFYRKKQIELNDEVTNQTGERPGTLHKEIAITGNLRLVQLLVAAMFVFLRLWKDSLASLCILLLWPLHDPNPAYA